MSTHMDPGCDDETMPTGVRVYPSTSDKVGSCCFCHRHTVLDPPGIAKHDVFVTQGEGGIFVRFCRQCASDFNLATGEKVIQRGVMSFKKARKRLIAACRETQFSGARMSFEQTNGCDKDTVLWAMRSIFSDAPPVLRKALCEMYLALYDGR